MRENTLWGADQSKVLNRRVLMSLKCSMVAWAETGQFREVDAVGLGISDF